MDKFESDRDAAENAAEARRDVQAAEHRTEQKAEELKNDASEWAEKTGNRISEAGHNVKHSAEELAHSAQRKIDEEKMEGGVLDRMKDGAERVIKKDLDHDGKIG